MRFHVLGVPHTISTPDYSSCAFTAKVVKLCKMLSACGHDVLHYGHEASQVEASNVAVTTDADLKSSYGDHDWRRSGWPKFTLSDPVYNAFNVNALRELKDRMRPGDMLLLTFGAAHRQLAYALPDAIVVESGIGYPGGGFAPYRVFESYAVMHAYHGVQKVEFATNNFWYDVVIPNAFDVTQFDYRAKKDDYLLFLGRLGIGKGAHIARQIAEATGSRLVVAGVGDQGIFLGCKNAELVGAVGPTQRAELLAKARAVLCPSTFLEPFCGVQIEAMLSGTPVISSDWGAFAEYNKHGETGFRCRTFAQFKLAVEQASTIDPRKCRRWAIKFSLENVAPQYDAYFMTVADIYGGKGWYEEQPCSDLSRSPQVHSPAVQSARPCSLSPEQQSDISA